MPLWMRQALAQRAVMEEAGTEDQGGGGGGGEGGEGKGGETPPTKPSDAEAKLLKESMARKAKIQELENQLKAFEGIDPAAVKQLLAEQAAAKQAQIDAEQKALEKSGEFDKVKKQIVDAHTAEKATLQQQIDALKNDLGSKATAIDDLTIGLAFTNSKVIPEKTTFTPSKARIIYGAHFDRNEQGQIVGYDKPRGAAGRAPLVGSDGEPLAFDAVIEKLVESDPEKDQILRANVKPGAGSASIAGKTNSDNGAPKVTGRDRILAGLKGNKLTSGKDLKLS